MKFESSDPIVRFCNNSDRELLHLSRSFFKHSKRIIRLGRKRTRIIRLYLYLYLRAMNALRWGAHNVFDLFVRGDDELFIRSGPDVNLRPAGLTKVSPSPEAPWVPVSLFPTRALTGRGAFLRSSPFAHNR